MPPKKAPKPPKAPKTTKNPPQIFDMQSELAKLKQLMDQQFQEVQKDPR
jgi:hypothetical protein